MTTVTLLQALTDEALASAFPHTTMQAALRQTLLIRSTSALTRAAKCSSAPGILTAAAPIASWQLPWLAEPTAILRPGVTEWLRLNLNALTLHLPRTSGAGVVVVRDAWLRMTLAVIHAVRHCPEPKVRISVVHDALWSVAQRLSADWQLEVALDGTTWAHRCAAAVELALAVNSSDTDAVREALRDVYQHASSGLATLDPATTRH